MGCSTYDKRSDSIGTIDSLTNLFGYFKAMRGCRSKLRYFDWDDHGFT